MQANDNTKGYEYLESPLSPQEPDTNESETNHSERRYPIRDCPAPERLMYMHI